MFDYTITDSSFITRVYVVSVNRHSVICGVEIRGERDYTYDVPRDCWIDAVRMVRDGGSYGKAYNRYVKGHPYN